MSLHSCGVLITLHHVNHKDEQHFKKTVPCPDLRLKKENVPLACYVRDSVVPQWHVTCNVIPLQLASSVPRSMKLALLPTVHAPAGQESLRHIALQHTRDRFRTTTQTARETVGIGRHRVSPNNIRRRLQAIRVHAAPRNRLR